MISSVPWLIRIDFTGVFQWLISSLMYLWSDTKILYHLNLFKLIETCYMAQNVVSFGGCPCAVEKNACPLLGGEYSQHWLGAAGWQRCSSALYPHDDLSMTAIKCWERSVLMVLFISSLSFINFCVYFEVLCLDVYIL